MYITEEPKNLLLVLVSEFEPVKTSGSESYDLNQRAILVIAFTRPLQKPFPSTIGEPKNLYWKTQKPLLENPKSFYQYITGEPKNLYWKTQKPLLENPKTFTGKPKKLLLPKNLYWKTQKPLLENPKTFTGKPKKLLLVHCWRT